MQTRAAVRDVTLRAERLSIYPSAVDGRAQTNTGPSSLYINFQSSDTAKFCEGNVTLLNEAHHLHAEDLPTGATEDAHSPRDQ